MVNVINKKKKLILCSGVNEAISFCLWLNDCMVTITDVNWQM